MQYRQTVGDIISFLQQYPKQAKISFLTSSYSDSLYWLSDYTKEDHSNKEKTKHVYVDIGSEES